MPMPNLKEIGACPVFSLRNGPILPLPCDLELASKAGYSASEIDRALTTRGRASADGELGMQNCKDDFFRGDSDRRILFEDPILIHSTASGIWASKWRGVMVFGNSLTLFKPWDH